LFFFFTDTATTELYTLSLHDALPIWGRVPARRRRWLIMRGLTVTGERHGPVRWWRRRSLRARLTIITSAGLALALAAAAVLLVNSLRVALIRGLDDSARQ